MKTEDIQELLIARGYTQRNASLVAKEIQLIEPCLIPLWNNWVADSNDCEDYEVSGYSIRYFMQKLKMAYPAALLTIDWLLKEPDKAKEALTRRH